MYRIHIKFSHANNIDSLVSRHIQNEFRQRCVPLEKWMTNETKGIYWAINASLHWHTNSIACHLMWLQLKKLEMSSYQKRNLNQVYQFWKPLILGSFSTTILIFPLPPLCFIDNWHIYQKAMNHLMLYFNVHATSKHVPRHMAREWQIIQCRTLNRL